jgi:hypothetical protein
MRDGVREVRAQQIGSTICDRLFAGESLSQICRDPAMPDEPTVMRWLAQIPEFVDEFEFTNQLLAEDRAAEAVSIADNADTSAGSGYGRKDSHGGREEFARRRLRLAIRHWVAESIAACQEMMRRFIECYRFGSRTSAIPGSEHGEL